MTRTNLPRGKNKDVRLLRCHNPLTSVSLYLYLLHSSSLTPFHQGAHVSSNGRPAD